MGDHAQPKNFAALKTQHTERNILAIAIVYIISKYKQRFPCRVLVDGGSQINMISERMVHMTGLKRQYAPIQFQCANKTVGTSNFKQFSPKLSQEEEQYVNSCAQKLDLRNSNVHALLTGTQSSVYVVYYDRCIISM
uniref:Peptidase aspartic putative domain-containing protein n=1 Tax=Glossina palpalis gambiensis TaxID=67801 RepID=A0A1B0BHQ8_9MUSC